MGLGRILKACEKTFFYTAFITMALVILPGIPPYVTFRSFRVTPPQKLVGPLAPNGILDKATKLVDGGIEGPESIVIVKNTLYTGLADGRVVRIEDTAKGAKISTVAQLGKQCVWGQSDAEGCAHPLGIRVNSAGELVVADSFQGIVAVDPKTGKTTEYFDPNLPIEGMPAGFPDDLDIAQDGTIYWSDVTQLKAFSLVNMADLTGRLIKYDPKTKNNTVLFRDLGMANGVQLSAKEDYVLVVETLRGRVLRYYLKGPKAGTHDVFVDGLPGMPDNIRASGKGGFYISLVCPPNQLFVTTGKLPQLRKLLFRIQWIALTVLRLVDSISVFSGKYLNQLISHVETFGSYGTPFPITAPIIVEVDGTGKIIGSLHANTKKNEILSITQFTRGDKYAYMGSYIMDKIWKIPDGEIEGAESIVVVNNTVYTGLGDGRVVRIEETEKGAKISTVAQLGQPCGIPIHRLDDRETRDCARPLGIRVNSAGELVVADAFKGIVAVDPKTGQTTQYFDLNVPIDGLPANFPDDLDILKDGTIYWSDVTQLKEFGPVHMTDETGRFIKYDPKTKKNTVLMQDLGFANGVQLSEREDFVLIVESLRMRVHRYYLKGPKAGTHDVFVDGLPGIPDNIRPNGKGGFYITLLCPPNQLFLSTATLPQLRKLLFRTQWIALTFLRLVDSIRVFSGAYLNQVIDYLENFGSFGTPIPITAPIIVEVDNDGNILASLHANMKKNEDLGITQFTRGDKHAYMGSAALDQIWKISVDELS